MGDLDIQAAAASIADKLKQANVELRGVSGISGAAKVAPKVIEAVEEFCADTRWKGQTKKDLAIAVILMLVPIPAPLKPFAAMALGFIIEKALAEFKRHGAPRMAALWQSVKGWFGAK